MNICTATLSFGLSDLHDPGAIQRTTHSCDKPSGHELPHHCPLCGSTWSLPGVTAEAAGPGTTGGDQ